MNSKSYEKVLEFFKSLLIYSFLFVLYKIGDRNKKKIYLIGSCYGKKRSDNAAALFNYIIQHTNHKVYFVENIKSGSNYLKRGSIKCFYHFFNAEAVFFSHSLSDLLPQLHNLPVLFSSQKRPIKIFIQHGITGLKRVDHYLKKNIAAANYVIVSSMIEKSHFLKIGIPDSKVKVTGFPVHDEANFGLRKKIILIFFTWQKININYRKVKEVIQNPIILELISEYKYEIVVYHHDMNPRPNYCIRSNGTKSKYYKGLKKAIGEARLLITDNSSIAWDFIYCGRDVVFYKPDPNSYLRLDKAGFPVAENLDELAVLIEPLLSKKLSSTSMNRYFTYIDSKNCERVFKLGF